MEIIIKKKKIMNMCILSRTYYLLRLHVQFKAFDFLCSISVCYACTKFFSVLVLIYLKCEKEIMENFSKWRSETKSITNGKSFYLFFCYNNIRKYGNHLQWKSYFNLIEVHSRHAAHSLEKKKNCLKFKPIYSYCFS